MLIGPGGAELAAATSMCNPSRRRRLSSECQDPCVMPRSWQLFYRGIEGWHKRVSPKEVIQANITVPNKVCLFACLGFLDLKSNDRDKPPIGGGGFALFAARAEESSRRLWCGVRQRRCLLINTELKRMAFRWLLPIVSIRAGFVRRPFGCAG